jgi:hypothetical protein
MSSLLEVQRAMCAALLQGDREALTEWIDDSDAFDIHRNNVAASLTQVLADSFPALQRLVDERFFAYAAHEFISQVPPAQPRLALYGTAFPDFLAAFPPCRELVYLADVARLEWALQLAANAPTTPCIGADILSEVAPEDTPRLIFTLTPSHGYLASRFPVDRIWRANRPEGDAEETIDLDQGGVALEIRRTDSVELRVLPASVFAFRVALARGEHLERAAAAAFAHDPAFNLAAAIAILFEDGAVADLTLAEENP